MVHIINNSISVPAKLTRIRIPHTSLIFTCLFFLFITPCSAQTDAQNSDYYGSQNIYRFAESLYDKGEYFRAVGEYHRFLFVVSDSIVTDSVVYKIGECYRLIGEYSKAISYFEKVRNFSEDHSLRNESLYQIALCHFLRGDYRELRTKLEQYNSNNISILNKIEDLTALSYLNQMQWDNAFEFINQIDRNDSLLRGLKDFAIEGQNLRHKNKFVSGIFSSLVPGLGKIYCERTADGVFSLFLIGLTSFQAYQGFDKDGVKSISGWIYGGISSVFYLGNIYGSVVAAEIYNEQQSDKLLTKIRISLNVDLP